MKRESRSKVVVDTEKNRLTITLGSTVSNAEIERIYKEVEFCVSELKPGFSVVTDLTNCKIGHLAGLPTFRRIMEHLLEQKVGKVIRVVGRSKLIFNQISRITDQVQAYKPVYVATLEEAEEELSTISK